MKIITNFYGDKPILSRIYSRSLGLPLPLHCYMQTDSNYVALHIQIWDLYNFKTISSHSARTEPIYSGVWKSSLSNNHSIHTTLLRNENIYIEKKQNFLYWESEDYFLWYSNGKKPTFNRIFFEVLDQNPWYSWQFYKHCF